MMIKFYKEFFYLSLILLLAFVLRIINLTALPIFTDEAIYIRWIQIASNDPAWRFISLTDGKQPLFVWLGILSYRLFSDPLFAARFISVIAGVFTTLGLFFLGRELFNKKVGLLSALIWTIFPFAVWHDRLALMDSLLACFTVWGLWLEVLLIKRKRTDIALFLGGVIGFGLLTKPSANFLIYLLPFSLILIIRKFKDLKSKEIIFKWLPLAILATLIALMFNAVQRLSPFYYIVGLKNLTFIYSFQEVIGFGFSKGILRFWGNLKGLSVWLFIYLNTLLILIVASFVNWKENLRQKIYLLACFLFPFFALTFFGKVLYPRHLLFMTIPLVVLMADGLIRLADYIKSKLLLACPPKCKAFGVAIGCMLLVAYPLYFDSQIIFNIVNTPLPNVDRGQYLDDWPAGWGVLEAVDILDKQSQAQKIALGTEGTFGLTPFAFEIYLRNNSNIEIKGFWPISDGLSWLKENSLTKPTYLILKDTQEPKTEWNLNLQLVEKFKRGKGNNYLGLYRINY